MLTAKPQLNLKNAKGYFREHLATGDYYSEGKAVGGEWVGVGAAKLGLKGQVKEDDFLKMCDGVNPFTGKNLTVRRNTVRREDGQTVSNRRVSYDFVFSPPKSVSFTGLLQDERIAAAHDRAVRVALGELEKFAETRVRRGGADGERVTGNVVGVTFRHDTSRELDPHLHTHCVLFNATYDDVEGRWKALHATGMYRAQKYLERLYNHELAKDLRAMGYQLVKNDRDFEIKGVPKETIERFSKRRQQIDEEVERRMLAGDVKGSMIELRDQVAHENRRRKIKNVKTKELRQRWKAEMAPGEREAMKELSAVAPSVLKLLWYGDRNGEPPPPPPPADAGKLLGWAKEHVFERQAVTTDYDLMGHALAHGCGENFELKDLRHEFETAVRGGKYIRDETTRKLTTPEAREREAEIASAAMGGMGVFKPFNETPRVSSSLSEEHARAATKILASRDFITLLQGGAGTGKSSTLREVVKGLREAGHRVSVMAPQREQVADLEKNGLEASTLASKLTSLRGFPSGAVVILDEAGQVGGEDMLALIRRVEAGGGRLILSGDTRQHGAVAASDALRVIEEQTPLRPVRLTTIYRQEEREYREAVQAASEGRGMDALAMLDRMGRVREIDEADRLEALARDYSAAVERKESVLVVAPTWVEVNAANDAIRERLKEEGKLEQGVSVASWQSLQLTEAQKRDERFYEAGVKAVFVRDYGRFKAGDACEVAGLEADGVRLVKDGKASTVGFEHAARFVVAKERQIDVAPGERLQMKFNGQSADEKPIRNGELVTVQRVLKDGRVVVRDDTGERKILKPDQRLFVPGYAVTSYASQGKTVDTVLASYAGEQAPANQNQFYVAISRARKNVQIYTPDKEALRLQVEQATKRDLALSITPRREEAQKPVREHKPRRGIMEGVEWAWRRSWLAQAIRERVGQRIARREAAAQRERQRLAAEKAMQERMAQEQAQRPSIHQTPYNHPTIRPGQHRGPRIGM